MFSGKFRSHRVSAELRLWRHVARQEYGTKQVEAIAVEESRRWLVITVLVKYF